MNKTAVSPQRNYLIWMLLVLLTAVFLRLFFITQAPPGLTHDEADHGITAWSIVNGARDIYFTIGYGREPLFDYVTALVMSALGATFLAGRLTAVFFSLIMIAGMGAWVRRAFDWQTAVFTAAGLAVGFWPVMTARQALRSETLPALFVLAVYLFWCGLLSGKGAETQRKKQVVYFVGAGFVLGLTAYTYIPARVLWLIFPATVVYLAWQKRPLFHQIWKQTIAMLAVALLTALPLLLYLFNNPAAESRIGQLSQPISSAVEGDFSLLWQHIREGLGIIAFTGDSYWRYNISGNPLLPWFFALLFFMGLAVASWWIVRGKSHAQTDMHETKNRAAAS
ncbi:MAG: glycosyltransferase family 39 protein, partial [Anaerolineae bacterium]|nr:glycosyltransferase family 39 protein [Anaerolineae bacterium]